MADLSNRCSSFAAVARDYTTMICPAQCFTPEKAHFTIEADVIASTALYAVRSNLDEDDALRDCFAAYNAARNDGQAILTHELK